MISRLMLGVVLCALAATSTRAEENTLTEPQRQEGWRLLFDGKSTRGWMTPKGQPLPQSHVQDGALNPHPCDYMLVYEKPLGNFVLALDFKISPKCNSGIFVRTAPLTPRPGKDVGFNGLEIAIDDTKEADLHDTGAIYDLVKPKLNAMKPVGEWNHLQVTCDRNLVAVEVNGQLVSRMDLDEWTAPNKRPDGSGHKFDIAYKDHPRTGYIGLQDHGSNCWYRNIKLRALDKASVLNSAWEVRFPRPFPEPTWLGTHQRLCFGVEDKNLDDVIKAGTNVVCGGTNASGVGFAGGPFILGANGAEFVDIRSGVPVPAKTLQELRARVDKAHAKGAKVLGEVIRFYMTPWIQAEHPDWQDISSPGGKPITVEQLKDSAVLGCWNSPYGDWFIKSQVELVKRLDWDGYNMDGFGCWSHCFCPHCRSAYTSDTGKEIPASGDVNNSDFRHYLKWRLDRYTHFVRKWTAALKAIKPDFVAAPWTTGPGRWWHWMGAPGAEGTDALHRVLDAPFLEMFWDFPADQGSNLLPAFTCRYYRGLTGDRPAWMLPYLCEQGQFNMQPPRAECDLREMTVLTNGCLVGQGDWQQNEGTPLAHFNTMLSEREPFTKGSRSLKWAAMLVGESSRLLYGLPGARTEVPLGSWIGSGVDTPDIGRLAPGERRMPAHMESAVGVFRAMMEDHLPLDIIIEPDVEDLKTLEQYQVLILPNAACLSQKALDTIGAFVKQGGGLVAMHESSLCNEFGDRRPDFGLADLYGAHFKGTEDYSARWPNYPKWTELYLGITKPDLHPIADDPIVRSNYRRGSDRLQYIGWMTNVEVATGAVKLGRRLTTPPEWPFMVFNQPGRGRSAYFAEDIGQAYFIAPYQYQRRLISNAVRWAAGTKKPPVRVDAPLCVQAAFYSQDDGKRTIVHLLNEVNTSANRALPENNPSQREETLPILDITVTLNDPKVASAFQEPGHRPLPLKRTAEGVEVTVPRLDLHTMVVFQ